MRIVDAARAVLLGRVERFVADWGVRSVRSERGAVLVETALVAPLMLGMIFGAGEFGIMFRDKVSLQSASRQAVIAGAKAGNLPDADYRIVEAIRGSVASSTAAGSPAIGTSQIDKVIIYKSTTVDGLPSSACLTLASPSHGVGGVCNVYYGSELATGTGTGSTADSFQSWSNCGACWTPASRTSSDYIGVQIELLHTWDTPFLGTITGAPNGFVLIDRFVMQVEL